MDQQRASADVRKHASCVSVTGKNVVRTKAKCVSYRNVRVIRVAINKGSCLERDREKKSQIEEI